MNDISEDDDYEGARGAALTLPTWVLRVWERHATRRLTRGEPTRRERARLLAVRGVLNDRQRA